MRPGRQENRCTSARLLAEDRHGRAAGERDRAAAVAGGNSHVLLALDLVGDAATGPPVSKLYSVLPSRASSVRKLPLRSPVNSTLPAVGVIVAYIGVGHLTRNAIL